MMAWRRREQCRAMLAATVVVGALLWLTGCATTDEHSDMPWNTPQSWEGSPGIPGLTPQY